jgi:SAM-dependent methyltransferase
MEPEEFARLYALEETFWWFEGMRRITAALLDPVCPPGPDRTILDAGCGTGWNLRWLRRYAGGGRVVGIDVDPVAVELSRKRQREDIIQASVLHLPFSESTFDLVTSFDVLPQLPGEASDVLAVREMGRVLRPGGFLVVRGAAYEWLRSSHDEALATHRRYRLRTLIERLTSTGLNVVRATYANAVLLPAAVLHRLLLQRLGFTASGSDVRPLPSGLAWLEGTLEAILRFEAGLLRTDRVRFPFGLSAICVARKPPAPERQ